MESVEQRAERIRHKRAEAARLESEALDELVELVPVAQKQMTLMTLALLCGFKTRKPLYDAMNRRGAG